MPKKENKEKIRRMLLQADGILHSALFQAKQEGWSVAEFRYYCIEWGLESRLELLTEEYKQYSK